MAVTPADLEPGPPTPDPVREVPPDDRFCDLILNGGVASGVVYPWAIVELARHYRFRSIGGNSVGAMAAALAAAAEYGRCCGHADAFEVLRRVPRNLAEEDGEGRTQMLRLFQPGARLHRLFRCFLAGVHHLNAAKPVRHAWLLVLRDVLGEYGLGRWLLAGILVLLLPALVLTDSPFILAGVVLIVTVCLVVSEHVARKHDHDRAFLLLALGAWLTFVHVTAALFLCGRIGLHADSVRWAVAGLLPLLGVPGWVVLVALLGGARVRPDLHALAENGYGLCSGKAQPDLPGQSPPEAALVEWLHRGIQLSAGRQREDPPLTFGDLWKAPRAGLPMGGSSESISLELFSTNVTHSRPVIWPLRDPDARLFFRRDEWERFFPPTLLEALCKAASPYAPASDTASDPSAVGNEKYLELPGAAMPIAIAARLSLSFPLLFSCIPVYAIDYEPRRGQRELRQCWLTDGGLCTNFPIHLFDAAHPRWPTFGLMLSSRISTPDYVNESVWLPELHRDGRAPEWLREVPGAKGPEDKKAGLLGLLVGMATSTLRWNDSLVSRLPQVRNRVLRMALRPGEGQLNIAMSGQTILRMAHEYGTAGGRKLVERFVSNTGVPTVAWREHVYVRALNELRALASHLRTYEEASTAAGFTLPLAQVLAAALQVRPLRQKDRVTDPYGEPLAPAQEAVLQDAVKAVAALSALLVAAEPYLGPYRPLPQTRLHLRSRI